ncbi:hypothetical protein [Pseudomonas syringae]|uniref:hypothetical protein n=1 Tax=Pseudomonas syringae TaxID=317 RepID=UPI0023F7F58B|nr:hypothetical protein [Pseudomonas syringae]MDF7792894.1 hypothetical protein [Pseudomonas syringae]
MKITRPMLGRPVSNNESGASHGNSMSEALGISPNPIVRNQWFNNQEIQLDGWHFVSCRFDNCKLTLGTTEFSFESCYIDEETQVIYSVALVNIVRLFNLRNSPMHEKFPYFAPTFNADGTISIGAEKWT